MFRLDAASRITLTGLAALALAMGVGRFAFTPMLPLMQDDGFLDIDSGGMLAAGHFLGYLVGAMTAARVGLAPRRLFRLALVIIAATTLGMGVTDRYAGWLVMRFAAGICSAWVLVLVGNYHLNALAQLGRASAQGWVFSGVGAGIAAAGLACLAFMLLAIPSAPAWLLLGAASTGVAVLIARAIRDELPAERRAPRTPASQRSPLSWGLIVAYGTAGAGYTIPATYLPVMAREIVASPMVFGWSWPIFGLAAFASTLLVATFQSRYSNRRIWASGQVLMAAGLLLPVAFPHIGAIALAGLCVGGTFMVVTMVGMREAHRIAPQPDVIRHIAAMTTAFASGQIFGPILASAWFSVSGRLSGALVLTSALLVVSLIGLLRPVPQPRGHEA